MPSSDGIDVRGLLDVVMNFVLQIGESLMSPLILNMASDRDHLGWRRDNMQMAAGRTACLTGGAMTGRPPFHHLTDDLIRHLLRLPNKGNNSPAVMVISQFVTSGSPGSTKDLIGRGL